MEKLVQDPVKSPYMKGYKFRMIVAVSKDQSMAEPVEYEVVCDSLVKAMYLSTEAYAPSMTLTERVTILGFKLVSSVKI